MQIGITEPSCFSEEAIYLLTKLGSVEFYSDQDLSLEEFIKDKDVLFVRLKYLWNETLLKNAVKLKHLCSPTTGLNHLDVSWLEKNKINLISLKGDFKFLEQIKATPEHTFGLALALLRNYKTIFSERTQLTWNRDRYRGYEISGSRAGIIGFGRVGKILSDYLTCFGSTVTVFDSNTQQYNATTQSGTVSFSPSKRELILKNDIIFLCASYTDGEYVIGEEEMELMKNKFFINTSRGELVNEAELIRRVKQGHFKGVALDVITDEQKSANLPELLLMTENHNFILTPHIGGATYSSMWKTELRMVEKLSEVLHNG